MRKVIFVLFILFPGIGVRAQTLQNYLEIATDSNPGLKARYAEFEAAMQKIPQVKSLQDYKIQTHHK